MKNKPSVFNNLYDFTFILKISSIMKYNIFILTPFNYWTFCDFINREDIIPYCTKPLKITTESEHLINVFSHKN
ncbi:hypothetical protein SDC9_160650 [bioreactor metagenome]|uniref:Uncharacterized protein n=1 Tax=bioreactor metagenome TaxID=1076179 RepID=A0A645FJ05_9ZZZZ